jgi:hypothetical protein
LKGRGFNPADQAVVLKGRDFNPADQAVVLKGGTSIQLIKLLS